jgi:hypothetical protein
MIIDGKWVFRSSGSEDLTMNGTTQVNSDHISLGKNGDVTTDDPSMGYADGGSDLFLYVRVKTVGTAAITTVKVETAPGSATKDTPGTFVTAISKDIPSGSIVANTTIARLQLPLGLQRNIRFSIVGAAAATSVVNAWIATT